MLFHGRKFECGRSIFTSSFVIYREMDKYIKFEQDRTIRL